MNLSLKIKDGKSIFQAYFVAYFVFELFSLHNQNDYGPTHTKLNNTEHQQIMCEKYFNGLFTDILK